MHHSAPVSIPGSRPTLTKLLCREAEPPGDGPLPRAARRLLRPVAALALFAAASQGQLVPLDADVSGLPVMTLNSQGTYQPRHGPARPAYVVASSHPDIVGKSVQVGSDLAVIKGGRLRIKDSLVQIRGDVWLRDDGFLEFVNCRVELVNQYPREHSYWWEGGHLSTSRSLIGGSVYGGLPQMVVFQLNRGLWTAKDTTVQYSGGILLGEGRLGFSADSYLRGGTLIADGLHQGQHPDAIIMSGAGDAVLRNSVFNIHLFLYADGKAAFNSSLNLDNQRTIGSEVYGDMLVHDTLGSARAAVTKDIPGSPYRLELENVRVPYWFVSAFEVRQPGTGIHPAVFELENTTAVIVSVHGRDLQGSPKLTGPWSSHYPAPLPDLPSDILPGEHVMPPGCGVQMGNVTFKAPQSQWARVQAWGLYLKGDATNVTVSGPTRLAEIFLQEGRLTISGTEHYHPHVVANTIDLHRDSVLTLRNISLGGVGIETWIQCEILVQGVATCTVDNSIVRNLLLRSKDEPFPGPFYGVNQGRITLRNSIERNPIQIYQTGQAVFDVGRAKPNESFDQNNLDFEQGFQTNGLPEYWRGAGLAGAAELTDRRPGTRGGRALQYRSTAVAGDLIKDLVVNQGCHVELSGWARAQTLPLGSSILAQVKGSGGGSVVLPILPVASKWIYFRTAPYEVKPADGVVRFHVSHLGVSAGVLSVLLDDVEVKVSPWWEDDNLVNLDFEAGKSRNLGYPDLFFRAPDYWKTWNCDSLPDSRERRTGSTGGYSTRSTVRNGESQLYKELSFLSPGQVLVLKGWCKTIPRASAFPVKIHIGEGSSWWDSTAGNNQLQTIHDAANGWRSFSLSYTVPPSTVTTRLAITGGSPGDVILVDDLEATIQ